MSTIRSSFNSNWSEEILSSGLVILSCLCYLAPASWPQFSIALTGFLLTAVWGVLSKHWKLTRGDGLALGCAAFFLLYHRWGAVALAPALKHGLSLFLIWTVCAVFRRLRPPLLSALLVAELILLGGVLFQAFWPEAHYQFMMQSGYDYIMLNSRGFSSFASEPSALARITSGLLVLTFCCLEKKILPKLLSVFLSTLLIFLSRSWTGILLLTIVLLGLCWVQFRTVLKLFPAVVLAFLCVLIVPSTSGPHSIVRTSTGGEAPAGVFADNSLMCRWYPLLMGTLHLIEHPFGNGRARLREADFSTLSAEYKVPLRMDAALRKLGSGDRERQNKILFSQQIGGMSGGTSGRFFATGLFRMGIFFPLCFALFLWGLGLFRWRVLPVTVWILAFAVMSSGVIIPIFWLVAGSATQAEDRRRS